MDPTLMQDEAGNIWEVDESGNPIRLVQRAGGQPSQGRIIPNAPDPTAPYQGPQAAAGARSAQADAYVDEATRGARVREANADAEAQELANEQTRRELENGPRPQPVSGAQRAEAIQGLTSALALSNYITDIEQQYEVGPGATSGLRGILDYLPSEQNQRFDRAGNSARGTVGSVLGFTGGQLNSVDEAQMNVGPFIPQASDRDGTIEDSVGRLRNLQQQAIDRSVAILGGVPDANGNIIPVPQGARATPEAAARIQAGEDPQSVWDQQFITGGQDAPQAAAFGSDTRTVPIPPEMQAEYEQWVTSRLQNGFSPAEYSRFRQSLNEKYGFARDLDGYVDEGQRILEGFREGRDLNLQIDPAQEEMTGLEQLRNNAINNPVGAAVASSANALTMGAGEVLMGDEYQALREERPYSTLAGDVAGSIVGTGGIGMIGRNTIGRALPRLMGGGGRSQFGRNVAADATYAAGYSGVTGGDVAQDTGLGILGSAGGQLLTRGAGRMLTGADVSPDARYLQERGVPLTTGQLLGGFARDVENRAISIPGPGDMIRNRYGDGYEAFNRAAFEDAGSSIGFTPTRIGREGAADLMGDSATGARGAVSDAYDMAVNGRNFRLDPELMQDIDTAAMGIDRLPPDLATNADLAFRNTFDPLARTNSVTGRQWQGMRRDLTGQRASQQGPGFPSNYRDVMSGGIDALDNFAARQGGPEVLENLGNANTANRLGNVVQDATNRAKGNDYVFSPSQLQFANQASQRRFPGENPLVQLADTGQRVLPQTIPNSGTADRLMQSGLLGGVLAGAGGAGYALDGGEGAATGAAIPTAAAILATLGGTRKGQVTLNRLIAGQRPQAVNNLGERLRRRSGLFGTAAMSQFVIPE